MVKHDTATPTTSPSTLGEDNKTDKFDQVLYQRNLFFAMVLTMSWQLAIVVIVPIVAGYKLDEHYNTSPWLTLIGFAVAILGVIGVLVHSIRLANERVKQYPGAKR